MNEVYLMLKEYKMRAIKHNQMAMESWYKGHKLRFKYNRLLSSMYAYSVKELIKRAL